MSRFTEFDRWGGAWTEIKLEMLEGYLQFYTQALKNRPSPTRPFVLRYIDAFAGNGSVNLARKGPGNIKKRERVIGSALRALSVDPPFRCLDFIELEPDRAAALEEACRKQFPNREVNVYLEDANTRIREICARTDWRNTRAVLFIDPYGMNFEFETLSSVADTGAIDVWYLFPTSAMSRQLPLQKNRMSPDKARALTRLLGDDSWQKLYAPVPQSDLFGETSHERQQGIDEIEAHVKHRLETIFPKVLAPKRMTTMGDQGGATMFSLFFAVSNSTPKAIELSTKVARYLLRDQAGAG